MAAGAYLGLAWPDPVAGLIGTGVIAVWAYSLIKSSAAVLLDAVAAYLRPGGYFITQQVGERNMACVKAPLGQAPGQPPIGRQAITATGLRLLAFLEYDVEYVVRDIESLVFWLNALDTAHADIAGPPPWPAPRS